MLYGLMLIYQTITQPLGQRLQSIKFFDRVMELDIRMMGSTKLRYLEWFPSVVEANRVQQTGARYSLTNLETSCGYSNPTTITFL